MKKLFGFLLILVSSICTAQKTVLVSPSDTIVIKSNANNVTRFSIADLKKIPGSTLGLVNIIDHKGAFRKKYEGVKGILLKDMLQKVEFPVTKFKDLCGVYFILKASDGYTVVYSWNELFNGEAGKNIFVVTQYNNISIEAMPERPMLLIMSDSKSGRIGIKGIMNIEIKKAE